MAQSLAQIYVHIIFSTKNLEPYLANTSIRKEMHSYIAKTLHELNCIPTIVGGVQDHIHILCNLTRTESTSKMIGETKRNSSKWIKTKGNELMDFQWQNGYGVFSVSHSIVPKVRKYIQNQEEHHKSTSFREEYINFLKYHEVEYDERYVWD